MISRSCPAHLEAGLTRAVLDEARVNYLSQNTASMSPTGTAIDVSDGKKNEKCASTDDLQSAQPSLSSTKGSQGKIPIAVFMHLQQSCNLEKPPLKTTVPITKVKSRAADVLRSAAFTMG